MEVPGARHQWHAAIALEDFMTHVTNFQRIVDMCNTAEFCSIDEAKIKHIMQWGLWIEEVRRGAGTWESEVAMGYRLQRFFLSSGSLRLSDAGVHSGSTYSVV